MNKNKSDFYVHNSNWEEVTSTESLTIEKEYSDILFFCDDAQEVIYKKMIDVFDNMKNPQTDIIHLVVIATVEGIKFDTVYRISIRRSSELIDIMIPFFEEIEDYETCDRIVKLYRRLHEN